MIKTLVYVDRTTHNIISLKEKEEIIYDCACTLIEDADLLEKFLAKKYKRAELLYMGHYTALEVQKEFFEECYARAEKEFNENYVEKTFTIED